MPTGVVTLDRPESMNALDAGAYAQLSEVWTEIRDDPSIQMSTSHRVLWSARW